MDTDGHGSTRMGKLFYANDANARELKPAPPNPVALEVTRLTLESKGTKRQESRHLDSYR